MKLNYTNGCTATSLTVDGVATVDMKIEDLQDVICKMVKKETDVATLQSCWKNLMESMGEYKYLGHCETCGDCIFEFTLDLEG